MPFLISRRAALVAVLASVPFVSAATYCFLRASLETQWPVDSILFMGLGHMIFYVFGFPLTTIYALLMSYIGTFLKATIGNDLQVLVVPTYVLLFEIQWIIWSQLIAWIRHRRMP